MARRAPSVSKSPGHAVRCSTVPSARRISVSPTRNSTLAPAGKGVVHSQEASLPPSVLQLNQPSDMLLLHHCNSLPVTQARKNGQRLQFVYFLRQGLR